MLSFGLILLIMVSKNKLSQGVGYMRVTFEMAANVAMDRFLIIITVNFIHGI